ncbi:MAG: DNA-binding protein WhiA [Eubacteriales bacterium]|nr:DNA-binding protein WhiA [Eubacteriales bacterium]
MTGSPQETNLQEKLQDEAIAKIRTNSEYWGFVLKLFKACALRTSGRSMSFTTARAGVFSLFVDVLELRGESGFELREEGRRQRIIWTDRQILRKLRQEIKEFLSELAKLSTVIADETHATQREILLCLLYLAIGSWSEPRDNYHLEFAFPRILPADLIKAVFSELGLNFKTIDRQSARVLYLKDGREIGDYLLLTGCTSSYLFYQQLRVEKEVKNRVNRIVNCDSANADRMATASARQFRAIEEIKKRRGLDFLPEKLRLTAELRLANPGLSLAELGAKFEPPLGKSGVNHRLKKIEELAENL